MIRKRSGALLKNSNLFFFRFLHVRKSPQKRLFDPKKGLWGSGKPVFEVKNLFFFHVFIHRDEIETLRDTFKSFEKKIDFAL